MVSASMRIARTCTLFTPKLTYPRVSNPPYDAQCIPDDKKLFLQNFNFTKKRPRENISVEDGSQRLRDSFDKFSKTVVLYGKRDRKFVERSHAWTPYISRQAIDPFCHAFFLIFIPAPHAFLVREHFDCKGFIPRTDLRNLLIYSLD